MVQQRLENRITNLMQILSESLMLTMRDAHSISWGCCRETFARYSLLQTWSCAVLNKAISSQYFKSHGLYPIWMNNTSKLDIEHASGYFMTVFMGAIFKRTLSEAQKTNTRTWHTPHSRYKTILVHFTPPKGEAVVYTTVDKSLASNALEISV